MIDLANGVRWIVAELKLLVAHIHQQGRVWPTMAASVPIVSANLNWALGNVVEVMPAGTVATDFRLHAVSIETCNQNAVFELVIYYGAGDTEISRVRFAVLGGFFGNAYYVLTGALVPGGSRIRAAVASSDGLANIATVGISICYHVVV